MNSLLEYKCELLLLLSVNAEYLINTSCYSGIMHNAFNDLIWSNLCWQNRQQPTVQWLNTQKIANGDRICEKPEVTHIRFLAITLHNFESSPPNVNKMVERRCNSELFGSHGSCTDCMFAWGSSPHWVGFFLFSNV